MFYHQPDEDQKKVETPVHALFCLTPAESRRLIAKGVAALPEVKWALQNGTICIARGVTDAFVVEELTGKEIANKSLYAAGIILDGELTLVPQGVRMQPIVLRRGEPVKMAPADALAEFTESDVYIKGANCIDPEGNAGVLVASDRSGTVGEFQPVVQARNSYLIVPVGLEKLVPAVAEASRACGLYHFKYSTGVPVGLIPLPNALVVTEVQAFAVLAGVRARHVASGGVAGSEGTVVLSLEGSAAQIEQALALLKAVRGEPPVGRPPGRASPMAAEHGYGAKAQYDATFPPVK
ncbi:MAG: hypothetical protein HY670_01635 [Chloroflexi bacterium]|nr:hypothetical protein [Chloroflexota bacterium]